MKTILTMMLAAAFLISRPVMAGDDKPKSEKSEKKKKDDKKDESKKDESKKDEKKADKGGW
jgi:hypothetical protein